VHRAEAVPEQVGVAVVSTVEPVRITAVERVHHRRELAVTSFDYEVVVVRHQAVRQAGGVRPRDSALETSEEVDPVRVEREDGLSVASP
jgi:hypothetical protein